MKKLRVELDRQSQPIYAPELSDTSVTVQLEAGVIKSISVPATAVFVLVGSRKMVFVSDSVIVFPAPGAFINQRGRIAGSMISTINTASNGSRVVWSDLYLLSKEDTVAHVEFYEK